MKHLVYLRTVLKHKGYVFRASIQLGCIWRGIVHDLSKFYPSEWGPYVEFFEGWWRANQKNKDLSPEGKTRQKVEERRARKAFDVAFHHHIHRNPHHPEYWIRRKQDGTYEPLEIPDIYVREMVADWFGASRAYSGKDTCFDWYWANREKIVLHPSTRLLVETLITDALLKAHKGKC